MEINLMAEYKNGTVLFTDRRDGGRQLASKLENYKDMKGVLVLALPRGGVVIGYEIAYHLNCPLDVSMHNRWYLLGNRVFYPHIQSERY